MSAAVARRGPDAAAASAPPLRPRNDPVYAQDVGCPGCGTRDRLLLILDHLRARHAYTREALMAFVEAVAGRGEGRT